MLSQGSLEETTAVLESGDALFAALIRSFSEYSDMATVFFSCLAAIQKLQINALLRIEENINFKREAELNEALLMTRQRS